MHAVKLKIIHTTPEAPDAEPQERFFEQEEITIGRDPASILQLFDPQTMRVSREHARIGRRDGTYYLTDVKSRNGTYLNEEKLPAEQPYPLHEGDWIKIGDFVLQFFPPRLEAPAAVPTPSASREASTDLHKLDENTQRLQKELTAQHGRVQTLAVERDQLLTRLREAENIIRTLREENNQLKSGVAKAADDDSAAATRRETEVEMRRLCEENQRLKSLAQTRPLSPAAAEYLHEILDLVLDAVVKLLPSPERFANEFEGTTIRPGGFFLLYKNSGLELKELLLYGGDSAQERAELLPLLKQSLDRVIAHQVALFEGYQMCARQAPNEILELLAPAKIKQLVQEKPGRGLAKVFPFWAAKEFWQAYCDEHKRYMEEDRKFYAQRIFQPIFMEAYYRRMSSFQIEMEESEKLIR
jgi:predicted component of type VI protein secretion system